MKACFDWFSSERLQSGDLQFSSLYRGGMGVLREQRVIRVMIIVNHLRVHKRRGLRGYRG